VMAKLYALVPNLARWRGEWREKFECYAEHPNSSAEDYKFVPCSYYCSEDTASNGCPWLWGGNGSSYYNPRGVEIEEDLAMLVRFGFHACMPNKDGSGGCNGCINLEKAFLRTQPWNEAGKKVTVNSRPVNPAGHNANMVLLADLLERIYTEADWPPYAPKLQMSLSDSGKSRADLWAFMSTVAVYKGFQESDKGCDDGTNIYSDGMMPSGFPCKTTFARPLTFHSGRSDCAGDDQPTLWRCDGFCRQSADWRTTCTTHRESCGGCSECPRVETYDEVTYRPRAFENLKDEDAPSDWFNGSMVTDYFDRAFGFTKRESVVIMGGHSLGHYHGEISGGFRYEWTHKQGEQLNNLYFRVISGVPGKHFERGKSDGVAIHTPFMTGTVGNQSARTGFVLHRGREITGGGHFQWFHQYERCPACQDGVNIDRHAYLWKDKITGINHGNRCCELCQKATSASGHRYKQDGKWYWDYDLTGLDASEEQDFTNLGCLQNSSVHETLLTADLGLAKKIPVDPDNGAPYDCPGLDTSGWVTLTPNDDVDEGSSMTMAEIVDQYANSQDLFANDFIAAWEKMLSNGNGPLKTNFEFVGVTCEVGGVTATEAEAYAGPVIKRLWKCSKA